MTTKIIGVTGGIACGKSTVQKFLEQRGYQCIDADDVVRDLYNDQKSGVYYTLRDWFPEIIMEDGSISRDLLRKLVFEQGHKKTVESIVHPYVRQALIDFSQNKPLVFWFVPLLFDSGLDQSCFCTIDVETVNHETQINRLMSRNKISEEQAELIVKAQMSASERFVRADFLILNESLEHMEEQISEILDRIGVS